MGDKTPEKGERLPAYAGPAWQAGRWEIIKAMVLP